MKRLFIFLLTCAMFLQSASALAAVGSDTSDTGLADGWTIRSNNADSDVSLDTDIRYEKTKSLKIVNRTPKQNGGFVEVKQLVNTESGKTYRIGFTAKGNDVPGASVTFGGTTKNLKVKSANWHWTDYEYTYQSTGAVTLTFTVNDKCGALWLDNVYVIEEGSSENLVRNGGFEGKAAVTAPDEGKEPAKDIHDADSFTAADIDSSFATVGFMPVYRTDDSRKSQAHIPSTDKQTVRYMGVDLDITAEVALSYDDDYLYFDIDVTDDKHYAFNNTNYWTADSIQFAVTGVEDDFGNEIGVVCDTENGTTGLFTGYAQSVNEKFKLDSKREGNITSYHVGVPWSALFEERPDEIKFDVLVNDNDGGGRLGGIDFSAGGIHQTKTNGGFMVARLMKENEDFYSWIEGPESLALEQVYNYSFYLMNNADTQKNFRVSIPAANFVESYDLPAKSGIKRTLSLGFAESGQQKMNVEVTSDGTTYTTGKNIKVARSQAQLKAFYDEKYPIVCAYRDELAELIKECQSRKLATTYLELGHGVLERFIEWMELDDKNKDYSNVELVAENLTQIYEKTKEMAQGYLDGTVEPVYVPKYISSQLEVDGKQFVASVDNNGVEERRPINFVGYLTWFYLLADDIPNLEKWGNNVLQTEVRMWDVIKSPDINSKWKTKDGTYHPIDFEVTESDKVSGKYSLKIVDKRETWTLNSYRYIYQKVRVKPNTTYHYGLSAKAQNARTQWFTVSDFSDRIMLNDTYDWRSFGGTYTTKDDQTEMTMKIYTEASCDYLYLDDLYIKEDGSDKNLLEDPGFESGESFADKEYTVDYDYIDTVRSWFQKAEDYNVRIDILLAGHNVSFFMRNYPELRYSGGGFYEYNLNADKIKELYRVYTEALIPAICDYKSFGTVCLTNEPAFNAADQSVSEFYKNDWCEYLKKTYNNDISFLNKAYGENYQSFEEVPLGKSQQCTVQEYDTRDFATDIFTQWHQWFADEVKKYAPNAIVHAKTMQYVYETDHRVSRSQLGIGTDMAKFASFSDVNGNDAGAGGSRPSLEMLGFRYDYQTSNFAAPVVNSEDHCYGGYVDAFGNAALDVGGLTGDQNSTGTAMAIWGGAMHGRGGSTIWIFERDRAYAKQQNFEGQLVTLRPDVIYKVGKATLDLNRLTYEVAALNNQPAEVGMLYSNTSRVFNLGHMNAASETYFALDHNGVKLHIINDLIPGSIKDLKMVVLPEVTHLKQDMLDALRDYIANGGHVVIVGDENSIRYSRFGMENDPDEVAYIKNNSTIIPAHLDGITMDSPAQEDLRKALADELQKVGMDRITIVDSKTGERVTDTDYWATTYEGDLLVQAMYMYHWDEPIEAKLLINGKPAGEIKELVTGKTYQETFPLVTGEPVVLRVDTNNPFIDTYGHWAEKEIVSLADQKTVSGMSETMFAPDRTITRAEFTALIVRMLGLEKSQNNAFSDVKASDWFAGEANAAAAAGLLAVSKEFSGNGVIGRGEMAYMLKKACEQKGKLKGEQKSFADISDDTAFAAEISAAGGMGLISGYEDGLFHPERSLTRAEAVMVLSKLAEALK